MERELTSDIEYVKFEDRPTQSRVPRDDCGSEGSDVEGFENQKIAVNACLRWKLYRKLPKKLISKFFLCFVVLLQVYLLAERNNYTVMHTTEAMSYVFMQRATSDSDKLVYQLKDIYDVYFMSHRIMTAYENAENMLSGVFQKLPCTATAKFCSPQVTFQYTPQDGEMMTATCNYSAFFRPEFIQGFTIGNADKKFTRANVTQSFSRRDRKDILAPKYCDNYFQDAVTNARYMKVMIPLKIAPPFRYVNLLQCFEWYTTVAFDLNYGSGSFKASLILEYRECDGEMPRKAMLDPAFPISLVAIAGVVWDSFLWGRLFRKEAQFKGWALFILVSDAALFVGSAFFIYYYLPVPDTTETAAARWLVYGAAGSLQFFSLLVFLRSTPRLYKLAESMRRSVVKLSYFLFEVTPIFVGFVFAGIMIAGWYSTNFRSFDESAVTLFSMFLGDGIDAVNSQAMLTNNSFERVASRVFVFTFTMIFIFAIVNTVRIIITETYQSTEEQSQKKKASTMFNEDLWDVDEDDIRGAEERLLDDERELERKKAVRLFMKKFLCSPQFWVRFLITCYVSAAVILYKYQYVDYLRDTRTLYAKLFIEPNTYPNDGLSDMRYFNYLKVRQQQEKTTSAYFKLNRTHPGCFTQTKTPTLQVTYGSFNFGAQNLTAFADFSQESATQTCDVVMSNVTLKTLGGRKCNTRDCRACPPIKDLEGRILVAKNQFYFRTAPNTMVSGCIDWNLQVRYDFTLRDGVVTVKMVSSHGNCGAPKKRAPIIVFWAVLIVLLTISIALTSMYRRQLFVDYCVMPTRSWRRAMICTDAFGLCVGISELIFVNVEYSPSDVIFDIRYMSMGILALLVWVALVGFTETFPGSGTLKSLFQEGLPKCIEFMVSAVPIFMGFVIFAMVVFGSVSYNFIDFTSTISSLFAAVNGDNIWGLINAANMPRVWVISRIYMIIFCCLFLLFIMNVFFLLFEGGFYKSKQQEEDSEENTIMQNFEMFDREDEEAKL